MHRLYLVNKHKAQIFEQCRSQFEAIFVTPIENWVSEYGGTQTSTSPNSNYKLNSYLHISA